MELSAWTVARVLGAGRWALGASVAWVEDASKEYPTCGSVLYFLSALILQMQDFLLINPSLKAYTWLVAEFFIFIKRETGHLQVND